MFEYEKSLRQVLRVWQCVPNHLVFPDLIYCHSCSIDILTYPFKIIQY